MNNFLKNLDHFFRTRKEDSTFDDPPIEDPDPIDVLQEKFFMFFL